MATNRRVLLKSRPQGEPTRDNFDVVDSPIPEPKDGEYLSRTIWMSLDPYMRGRMAETKGYAANVNLGDAMVGGTVGQVVKSNNPRFKEGDFVAEYSGWQSYAVSSGAMSMKLDPNVAPLSTALSVLGMPGMTAWWGLMQIGKPKAGETVVVSAASGAVGSVVGQLAKLHGCRAGRERRQQGQVLLRGEGTGLRRLRRLPRRRRQPVQGAARRRAQRHRYLFRECRRRRAGRRRAAAQRLRARAFVRTDLAI
jgi:NADPH:quinone reductase-like Zn-dependent oxidoreductase